MKLHGRPEAIGEIWAMGEYKLVEKSDANDLGRSKSKSFVDCNSGRVGGCRSALEREHFHNAEE